MLKDSSLPCRDIVDFLGDLTFLDQAARASGFLKRVSRKLAPAGFVKAVMLAAANLRTSFNAIALHTGHADAEACSRQNIHKRCNAAAVAFMRAVLDHAIALKTPVLPAPAAAASFKRIIIQDGSVIRFHDSAAGDFPADSGASGMKAMLRLQFAYDYKSGRTLIATPAAYSHTDTAAAGELLGELKPGDLCIRDMGYYKAEWFQRMDDAGVFYLSRLKPEVKIPREDGGPPMGLDEFLRGVRGPVFDKTIRVGAGRGYNTRLVAVRVPEEVAAERRRKLHEEARKRKKTPGALRLALAGWTVFVTNIPTETASPEELRKLYGLRWHVELVFKALKSNGCLRALAVHASNRHHLEVLLLAQLLQLVLNLRVWRMLSPATKGSPRLSLLKMAAFARETLAALWPDYPGPERWEKHMGVLLYRCLYDKRKRREHLDQIWESGLG
jgi:hypothetical protein